MSCGGIESTLFKPIMEGAGGVGVIVWVDKGALGKPSVRGAIVGVSVGVGVSKLILIIIDPLAMPSIITGGVAVDVGVGVGVGGSTLMLIISGAIGGPPPKGRDSVSESLYESVFDDVTSAVL